MEENLCSPALQENLNVNSSAWGRHSEPSVTESKRMVPTRFLQVYLQGRQCIYQDVHLMVFLSFRHSICGSRWHLCSLKDHEEQTL